MKNKMVRFGMGVLLVLGIQAVAFGAGFSPVEAYAATEPTITTITNENNSITRTRSEFIDWHRNTDLPIWVHFRNNVYSAAEFFDAYNGLVFMQGDVDRQNNRGVRALNMTIQEVQPQDVAPSQTLPATETITAVTPSADIGFDRWALVDAWFSYEDIQTMFEQEVIRLVNIIRAEYGLPSVTFRSDIAVVARMRSDEMIVYDVGGHISPTTGLEHTEHARAMGLNLAYAGENMGRRAPNPQAVVDGWMGSTVGHRDFILSGHSTSRFPQMRYIGVGFAFGGERNLTAWTLWQTCGSPAQ